MIKAIEIDASGGIARNEKEAIRKGRAQMASYLGKMRTRLAKATLAAHVAKAREKVLKPQKYGLEDVVQWNSETILNVTDAMKAHWREK